jgi:hypothetical protein|tara:strand:+ start:2487 stop:2771 length:285 start_codon:yes stop_codon:yes gene_type:complete
MFFLNHPNTQMMFSLGLSTSYVGRVVTAFIVLIARAYQVFMSPLFPNSCRFHPTCSDYFIQAVKSRGPIIGFWFGLQRILRCHPFSSGGFDPAP